MEKSLTRWLKGGDSFNQADRPGNDLLDLLMYATTKYNFAGFEEVSPGLKG